MFPCVMAGTRIARRDARRGGAQEAVCGALGLDVEATLLAKAGAEEPLQVPPLSVSF